MKNLKKGMLVFCVVLAFFLFSLIPFGAKTQGIDSRFGINAFVVNRYNYQEWDRPISAIKELGASWSREEFIWELIEPEKGSFEWDFYDKAVNSFSNSGINIMGVLDYSAPWATEDPTRVSADKYPPNISDWRNYVSTVVGRYKDRVHYWQIWNEPNINVFFKPAPDAAKYLDLLKNAYEVIKSIDPSSKVVIAGTSGVDVGYLRELEELNAGEYFDILAVHPYSFDFFSPPESNFLVNMQNATQIAHEFGGKPIWLTEFGWSTSDSNGVSEDVQSQYLSRLYLLSYPFNGIEKLFWYDLRNDGEDRLDRENNFGVINYDFSKKKSFLAYKNLTTILGGASFQKAHSSGENGIYDYAFTKNNLEIRAIWKINGSDNIILNSDGNTKVYDVLGNNIDSVLNNGVSSVSISNSPIFLISDGKYTTSSGISYGQAYDYEYIDQSSDLSLKPGEEKEVWLKLKNVGTATWKNDSANPLFLGTSNKVDRQSQFFDAKSWVGSNRPVKMLESSVKSGETATFVFKMKANNVPNGFYKEYFQPVIEGVMWMKDIGIYWGVEVNNMKSEDASKNTSKYSYSYVDQSNLSVLSKGEKKQVVLRLKNTGTTNWERGKFNLGTSIRKDRISIFNSDWQYENRIMLDQNLVAPGEIGSFTFNLKAPDIGGIYKEYFRPVVDGMGWLSDAGIYWQLSVN